VSAAFGHWQDLIVGIINDVKVLIGWLQAAGNFLDQVNGRRNAVANASGPPGRYGRQFGGSVVPGRVYDVGEGGPEQLFMYPGGGGGYVVPNQGGGAPAAAGGGGGTSVTVYAETNASAYDIAAELGWELRKLRRFG
jgi:SLT domain-containing protein